MAKKKWLHKILAILPSISLIVILLISSFEIGAYGDWNFYEKEYEKWKNYDISQITAYESTRRPAA